MQVPFNYIRCFATAQQCPLRDNCLRSIAAAQPTEDLEPTACVHPRYIDLVADGVPCRYHRPNQTATVAYGFSHLCDNMPHATARSVMAEVRFIFGSRRTYYRRRKGEEALTPDEQHVIAVIFHRHNISEAPRYDRYETMLDW